MFTLNLVDGTPPLPELDSIVHGVVWDYTACMCILDLVIDLGRSESAHQPHFLWQLLVVHERNH